MHLPPFEYITPQSLPETLSILQEKKGNSLPIAGGTDVLVLMKKGNLHPQYLVSLKDLSELHSITLEKQRCIIGSCVTVSQIEDSGLYPVNAAVRDLVNQMATPQIRNRATIGGNLCTAAACADFPPVLLVNDATVILSRKTATREVPLQTFFTGPRETIREKDELMVSISLRKSNPGSAYLKFGNRKAGNIPIVGVACSLLLENGRIKELKVAVTAAAPTPVLVEEAQGVAVSQKPESATWDAVVATIPRALSPISDLRGSAEYRIHLVKIATRRALQKAHTRLLRESDA
jgi:carbon-monoxide dehydrogenase medium subunit